MVKPAEGRGRQPATPRRTAIHQPPRGSFRKPVVGAVADRAQHERTNDAPVRPGRISDKKTKAVQNERADGPDKTNTTKVPLKNPLPMLSAKVVPSRTKKTTLKTKFALSNAKPSEAPTLNMKTTNQPKQTQTSETIIQSEEKKLRNTQEILFPSKQPSKLPIPEKSKFSELFLQSSDTQEIFTKMSEEVRRLIEAEKEANFQKVKENPINLALAERIEELQAETNRLQQENSDLREELELMEFRILEMDASPKRTISRGSDTRCDITEVDDVSDSGVMSLPTSEDEPHEFTPEGGRERDVKSRLMEMCRSAESVADRISLQQGLALIRHLEARIEGLESTIAAMCHEATLARSLSSSTENQPTDVKSPSGRIIATVLPFTDPSTDKKGHKTERETGDCLQESGIFEEGVEVVSHWTQTEWTSPHPPEGDLSQEIRKLTQIRERIEEQGAGCNKKLAVLSGGSDYTPTLKEVLFYRERLETLENRLALYESSGDAHLKQLSVRLEKEALLNAQVRHLNEKVKRLEDENRRLEEERCELEEAENDTRLRCQKLELKLSALGEKKSALKVQLQQATRVMSTLRDNMEAEEKKKIEARQYTSQLETLVRTYEQKNFELEEREMEVRYRLQMLENTMPALMMWNMWRMMYLMQSGGSSTPQMSLPAGIKSSEQLTKDAKSLTEREEELLMRLKALECKLAAESKLLEESRQVEESLTNKVIDLEKLIQRKDENIIEALETNPEEDVDIFDKLSKMAKERLEADKRIRDLEMKERLYQETLLQADSMFAELQGGFAKKMEEKNEELKEAEQRLIESESKLKRATADTAITDHLQEKIDSLEVEVAQLKNSLSKKEHDRQILHEEEKRLYKELQESLDQLDTLKRNIEGPLICELEAEKRKSKEFKMALENTEEELSKKSEEHTSEVNNFKRQLHKLNRDMLENEVTISELKEEVQTLEAAVDELKFSLVAEKESKDELRKSLEAELEKKDKIIEDLKTLIHQEPILKKKKSLKEELEEEIGIGDKVKWNHKLDEAPGVKDWVQETEDEMDHQIKIDTKQDEVYRVSEKSPNYLEQELNLKEENILNDNKKLLMDKEAEKVKNSIKEKLKALTLGIHKKGTTDHCNETLKTQILNHLPEDSSNTLSTMQCDVIYKESTSEGVFGETLPVNTIKSQGDTVKELSYLTPKKDICDKNTLMEAERKVPAEAINRELISRLFPIGTWSTCDLQAIVTNFDHHSEPQVDFQATLGVPVNSPQHYYPYLRSTDCQVAQKAVSGVSGKDIKGTLDNLTKAYQHSKGCSSCGQTLGLFLEDLIQQLGVKLPRVKIQLNLLQ